MVMAADLLPTQDSGEGAGLWRLCCQATYVHNQIKHTRPMTQQSNVTEGR